MAVGIAARPNGNLRNWDALDRLDLGSVGDERLRTASLSEDWSTVAAELIRPELAQLLPGRHAERLWTDCRRLPRRRAVDG